MSSQNLLLPGYGAFKPKNTKSLLERGSMRLALLPQASAKKEITFSPYGYYDDTTDIHDVHNYVQIHFQNRNQQIPILEQQIQGYRIKLGTKLRVVEIKTIEDNIRKLEKEKQEILSNAKYNEYLERITPYLEEWKEMKKEEGPSLRFGEEKRFSPDKLSLIRGFIKIASEYAPINLNLKSAGKSGLCPYCRNPLNNEEEGKIICETCNIYQDALTYDAEFSDISRINGSSNNNYINRETFMKGLTAYQGKQKADFPPDLFTKFNEYCLFGQVKVHLLTPETTRPIFKEIGYPGFYEDIILFLSMHPQIKRSLPDITEYELEVLQDYDQFMQKYVEIKGDERESALNSEYLRYILMKRRNIPCNKCDFKMPDTPSIRISNDSIARRVFTALGWEFQDTI